MMMKRYKLSSGVSWRRIGREVVILRAASGDYFSVADAAADAWEWLVDGTDADSVALRLAKEYAVSKAKADKDVAQLLAGLTKAGVLEETEAPASPRKTAARASSRKLPYAGLGLSAYARLEQTPPYAWATY